LEDLRQNVNILSLRQETVSRRWSCLYDVEKHFRLRDAIIDQVWQNKENHVADIEMGL
jgi:hypothetical protein